MKKYKLKVYLKFIDQIITMYLRASDTFKATETAMDILRKDKDDWEFTIVSCEEMKEYMSTKRVLKKMQKVIDKDKKKRSR